MDVVELISIKYPSDSYSINIFSSIFGGSSKAEAWKCCSQGVGLARSGSSSYQASGFAFLSFLISLKYESAYLKNYFHRMFTSLTLLHWPRGKLGDVRRERG